MPDSSPKLGVCQSALHLSSAALHCAAVISCSMLDFRNILIPKNTIAAPMTLQATEMAMQSSEQIADSLKFRRPWDTLGMRGNIFRSEDIEGRIGT